MSNIKKARKVLGIDKQESQFKEFQSRSRKALGIEKAEDQARSMYKAIKKKLIKFSKGYYNYRKPSDNASHVSETYPKNPSLKKMFLTTKYNYSNLGKK